MIDPDTMEAQAEPELPTGPGWRYEPKWDGFRCLAFKDGDAVRLKARSGKPLTRYFPEVAAMLSAIRAPTFVLDGELLGAGASGYSFEALQLRLHPAESRIRKLAAESPATYAVFDLLLDDKGRDLRSEPLKTRHAALERFVKKYNPPRLELTPGTEDRATAESWLADGKLEGVVAKRLEDPYREGERAMVKVKRQRTADCVVGGFRYASKGKLVASLLLGLYNAAGKLDHVGFTSGIAAADKPALTKRLEALRGGAGFTGDAPGGPSRWATERSAAWEPVKPKIVVEVGFDHVTGGRFRHGTRLLRFRPDKAPRQCTFEQIA
ncbi:MAG TPA: ATP-dependent DNA ligase [Caulobacteraceae bacterium]|jgi:ATP-dependent DNA ligase|nr:ATP-dependent DNA ligase [Caulobacteraceae bacterium]